MKPAEQTQINFIVECLRKGISHGSILAQFGKKWHNLSKRTFERRFKHADGLFQAEQKRIQELAEQEAAKEVEARKSQIMGAVERQLLLTQIATGKMKIKKPFVIGGKIMEYPAEPDFTDRKNAIAELNKMDGSYAPTKATINVNKAGLDAIAESYEP